MSIEKTISPTLSNLIAEANFTIQESQSTIKEKLLAVYEQAKIEGYSPEEARQLMVEKIVNVSDRYIRKILPDEAKRTYTTQIGTVPKLEDSQESKENVVNIPEPIITDLPEPTEELPRDDFDSSQDVVYDKDLMERYVKEISRLENELTKLNKEVTQLRMQKVGTFGNKFEFTYSFEMPSGDFVPFIVTVFPDKKDGYIRLDQEEIKRLKVKEARSK